MHKFIIDTQLPPRLAMFFKEQGFDAIHTTHFPDGHLLSDTEIRRIASQESRIVVTKDADFFDYYMVKGSPPAILMLSIGNVSNNELLALVQHNLTAIIEAFLNGSSLAVLSKTHLAVY